MPYTRISLFAGKPASWLKGISSSLQRALEENFDVPKGDCFQVFHQCQPNELVFDRTYYSCNRSDDFVLFHITAGRERSFIQKEKFYSNLVQYLTASIGIKSDDVMVVIATTSASDWSFCHGKPANDEIIIGGVSKC